MCDKNFISFHFHRKSQFSQSHFNKQSILSLLSFSAYSASFCSSVHVSFLLAFSSVPFQDDFRPTLGYWHICQSAHLTRRGPSRLAWLWQATPTSSSSIPGHPPSSALDLTVQTSTHNPVTLLGLPHSMSGFPSPGLGSITLTRISPNLQASSSHQALTSVPR